MALLSARSSRVSNSRRLTRPVSTSWLAWYDRRRFSSRDSDTSWNTSTPPVTVPVPSRIGEAVLSMYSSLPSLRISSIGRTDLIERMRRTATASGFSSGSQVSSWKARKISSMVRPRLSSSRQPVSSSATGFRYSTRPCASQVITPSPMDCSVICALSFSRNSASS